MYPSIYFSRLCALCLSVYAGRRCIAAGGPRLLLQWLRIPIGPFHGCCIYLYGIGTPARVCTIALLMDGAFPCEGYGRVSEVLPPFFLLFSFFFSVGRCTLRFLYYTRPAVVVVVLFTLYSRPDGENVVPLDVNNHFLRHWYNIYINIVSLSSTHSCPLRYLRLSQTKTRAKKLNSVGTVPHEFRETRAGVNTNCIFEIHLLHIVHFQNIL